MRRLTVTLLLIYAMVGTGVFISISSRTAKNCPTEDQARAYIYGAAWPMLYGFELLGADMKSIPNCPDTVVVGG